MKMTPEQKERMEKFMKAIVAAKEDAKSKGLKKGHGGVSEVQCPNCPEGKIRYSVAGSNGHMHAVCTNKCSSWME